MGELFTAIQQFLIALWFFVTYKPLVEAAIEEELAVVEETLLQRIKRRWKHSKEHAERQWQNVLSVKLDQELRGKQKKT
jgi:hypothetical protein